MSPLQLNNAITGYKNSLRECKTVGQRKETNILRITSSLCFVTRLRFMLASISLLSDVTAARDLLTYWPIEGAGGAYA